MFRYLLAPTMVALALTATGSAVLAQPKAPPRACFSAQDWGNWRASADARSIYLRVGLNQVFKLDLASACPELKWPNAHLITRIRGSDLICSPLDLDLQISDGPNTAIPCIVRGITPLTREDAAALPKDVRP